MLRRWPRCKALAAPARAERGIGNAVLLHGEPTLHTSRALIAADDMQGVSQKRTNLLGT
jgi:hypothetical protein